MAFVQRRLHTQRTFFTSSHWHPLSLSLRARSQKKRSLLTKNVEIYQQGEDMRHKSQGIKCGRKGKTLFQAE
jgi:hypothetical protein